MDENINYTELLLEMLEKKEYTKLRQTADDPNDTGLSQQRNAGLRHPLGHGSQPGSESSCHNYRFHTR